MATLLTRLTKARPHELPAALWAFAYFFALLASYYVLRPIRDEMAIQIGPDTLHTLFSYVFLTMLLLVPVFGFLTRRFPRRELLPWIYGFFALNLLAFYAILATTGAQSTAVAHGFFVWVSVFNLFAVSVFWSFMADLFDTEQAERMYGFIAAGGTLGALAGPLITAGLVKLLGPDRLALVSATLLVLAIFALLRLRAWSESSANSVGTAHEETSPLRGSVWSGLVEVVRSPYLLGICLFLFCYALLSTFMYFQQAELVPKSVGDSSDRMLLLAQADLLVNITTLLLQLFAFPRLIGRLGAHGMLMVMPVVSLVGFTALASHPLLVVLVAFGTLRRAGEFAISKPTRETLFNALPPDQKYRAKNVIDTLVHRGGDTTSAWIIAGLRSLGMSTQGVSWLAVAVCGAWLGTAVSLGRAAQAMRRAGLIPGPSRADGPRATDDLRDA